MTPQNICKVCNTLLEGTKHKDTLKSYTVNQIIIDEAVEEFKKFPTFKELLENSNIKYYKDLACSMEAIIGDEVSVMSQDNRLTYFKMRKPTLTEQGLFFDGRVVVGEVKFNDKNQ